MKIAFGMIVFEGDYVLKECLESVYPYASQILIAEGPVKYWQEQGRTTSTDNTNFILNNFPDPEKKIKIVHGQFSEKDQQCNAYMKFLNEDIDYLWNLDSDEVYKSEDIEQMINILDKEKYTSVDIRSCSFYGGFDNYIGGFEQQAGNFHRIFRVYPGVKWVTHRPPTIDYRKGDVPIRHLDGDTLFTKYGVQMYHYSYVFPEQVRKKIEYYKAKVSMANCLDNYFQRVYLPWTSGDNNVRAFIEKTYVGVHEFKPHLRGPAFTNKFNDTHPLAIQNSMKEFLSRISRELKTYERQNQ